MKPTPLLRSFWTSPLSHTAVELSDLRPTWSAEFIPLPAGLPVPWGSGLKSALLNSTAVPLTPLPSDGRGRKFVTAGKRPLSSDFHSAAVCRFPLLGERARVRASLGPD